MTQYSINDHALTHRITESQLNNIWLSRKVVVKKDI